ncbi:MAG: LysR family transcriptional regulator [Gammaproteobacteria bacterium]|nr:LysR family transcriptional regulator [Gammaproteobacteria bacterium]
MELANLHAFVAIAEYGSFSSAAEKLYLTQPAISKRIAQLESELEVKLFDRIGRGVQMTLAGQTLHQRSIQILQEVEDTRRAIVSLTDTVSGQLLMATSHHIALHRLPIYLKQYKEQFPQVTLDLKFTDSESGCRSVENGELEFAVVTLPSQTKPPLKSITLWEDELAIVVAPDHPLNFSQPLSVAELLRYDAIMPEQGTFTWEIVHKEFETEQRRIKVGLTSNYLETIKMLVSVGLGWSILPKSLLEHSELVILKLNNLQLSRNLGIVYHQNKTLSNAAQEFINILRNENITSHL